MSPATADIRLVGDVALEAREVLRRALAHSSARFGVYKRVFDRLGISGSDISHGDPVAILQRLPLLSDQDFRELSEESLQVGDQIVDLETSSGTTGRRKRRFISHTDDASDHEFLARLFEVCGVGESDRVACLDTDPVNLMASFTRAFDLLGVDESYMLCAGPDFESGVESLPELDPSVIVTVPSILERCLDKLERLYAGAPSRKLRSVIYVGEPVSSSLRSRLGSALGVEVFGYYGSTETAALGIECSAHDGIHLFTDRNVIEMLPYASGSGSGEIVVTSLKQWTLPLLRYNLGDSIEVCTGRCPCGLEFPRVEVTGRLGEAVSVLGSKLGYRPILDAVYDGSDHPALMQLVLTREGTDKLTIVLPEAMRLRQSEITDTLLDREPDLDFLVESKYLNLEFSFVHGDYFRATRKLARFVDRRDTIDGGVSSP